MSPQQKKELLAGRHYYLTKLADVLRRREALLANLEVINAIILRRVKPCSLTLRLSVQSPSGSLSSACQAL